MGEGVLLVVVLVGDAASGWEVDLGDSADCVVLPVGGVAFWVGLAEGSPHGVVGVVVGCEVGVAWAVGADGGGEGVLVVVDLGSGFPVVGVGVDVEVCSDFGCVAKLVVGVFGAGSAGSVFVGGCGGYAAVAGG